jgi:hypothetical protein
VILNRREEDKSLIEEDYGGGLLTINAVAVSDGQASIAWLVKNF